MAPSSRVQSIMVGKARQPEQGVGDNTVFSFSLSFSPRPQCGIVTPTYGKLPTSVKPQTHFRRLGSRVILNLIKPVFKMHHQIDKALKFVLTPIPNTLVFLSLTWPQNWLVGFRS